MPNIDVIRDDVKNLSPAEFEKKYPGMKQDAAQQLNDEELERVAGGAIGDDGVTVRRPRFGG